MPRRASQHLDFLAETLKMEADMREENTRPDTVQPDLVSGIFYTWT
jgi:hypothetical protein